MNQEEWLRRAKQRAAADVVPEAQYKKQVEPIGGGRGSDVGFQKIIPHLVLDVIEEMGIISDTLLQAGMKFYRMRRAALQPFEPMAVEVGDEGLGIASASDDEDRLRLVDWYRRCLAKPSLSHRDYQILVQICHPMPESSDPLQLMFETKAAVTLWQGAIETALNHLDEVLIEVREDIKRQDEYGVAS